MTPTQRERARLRIVKRALMLARAARALEFAAYTSDAVTTAEYSAVLKCQQHVSRVVSRLAKGL